MNSATSYVRLLNGYYSRGQYFQADVEKGTIRTPTGTRICALTDDFLRGFRNAVHFECGKATDRIFKTCGKRWGTTFVERFDRELTEHFGVPLQDMSTGIVENCLDEAFRYHGYGKLKVDLANYASGFVSLDVRDAVIPNVLGSSEKPCDALFAGFFASVFSYYAKTELDCLQTECTSRGNETSKFIVGLSSRLKQAAAWVNDRIPHAAILRRLTTEPS